jgi:HSP20 family protein
MAISRWDPFREMVTMQNRLNSLFQDYSRGEGDSTTAAGFAPPVDIYEDEHKLVLKLEVPGMRQEDLNIQIENRTLTVQGERKFDREEKQENFHRVEHRYGTFFRSFTLPNTVDAENVQASYDAGVLKLEFPKRAEAKPRQIKVSVGGQKQVEAGKSAQGSSTSPAQAPGSNTSAQAAGSQSGSQAASKTAAA